MNKYLIALTLLFLSSAASAETVQVTVSLANIREEAGSQHKIIAAAEKDDLLPVIDSEDDWWKVRLKDGKEGWIYKKAAKVVKEDYNLLIQAMAKDLLAPYLIWATLNEVYLEEYGAARLDVMVTTQWSRLDAEQQKNLMIHVAREFDRLCEENSVLKSRNQKTPYVAFFDRFNTLLGKANKSKAVFNEQD